MRRRKGFTMVEVTLVVVVILLLAGMTIPRYMGTLSTKRVDTAALQVTTAMRFARQMAITIRNPTTVTTAVGWERLCVVDAVTQDTLYTFRLPGGTAVQSMSGIPTFHPRGTSIGATITVGDANGARDVIVNVVSRVRIEDHTP